MNLSSSQFYLITPASLDLEDLLKQKQSEKTLSIDFLRYIIHLIIVENKYAFQIDKHKHEKKGFYLQESWLEFSYRPIRLHSQLLEKVRYNYADHTKWLVENGIIKRHPYKTGKSFGYALAKKYQHGLLMVHSVEDYKVLRKIKEVLNDMNHSKCAYELKFLIRHLESDKLTAKLQMALKNLGEDFKNDNITYANYISSIVGLVNIHNGTVRYSQKSSTDNRLHTSITMLPKIARKYLRYSGKPLVEVDLSSSIPYIFSTYLLSHLSVNQLLYSSNHLSIHHIMLEKTAETLCIQEVSEFVEEAISGTLYRTVKADLAKHLTNTELQKLYDQLCRKDKTVVPYTGTDSQLELVAKKGLLAMMFASNGKYRVIQKVMKKRFPTITQWIYDFKAWGKGRGRHKRLSHALFQIESYFMLFDVAKAFNSLHRGRAPILSLHDCLITTEDHVESLIGIMQERFLVGLIYRPSLKSVVWDDSETTVRYISPDAISDYEKISREIDRHLAKTG